MKYLKEVDVKFEGGVEAMPIFRFHKEEIKFLKKLIAINVKELKKYSSVDQVSFHRARTILKVITSYLLWKK